MIGSAYYHLIRYKKPNFKRKGTEITFLKGLDTEAFISGEPFLCCLDDGTLLDLRNFPFCFFDNPDLVGQDYGIYNMKYDSGAIIYFLPKENLFELWKYGTTKFHGFIIDYIPHKYLAVKKGINKSQRIVFWDIYQFYKSSLEKASATYLDEHKIDVETKTFTPAYVAQHWDELVKYCIQDALLVSKLGNFLINKLSEFGIRTTALYSSASLSLRYYSDRGKICTAYRYWKNEPEFLKMVMDSYQGGKFEMTQQGYFENIREYDITSAYPSETMQLYDLGLSYVERTSRYRKDAVYGFMKVMIDNRKGKYIPTGIKQGNLQIYPAGCFQAHCTKAEYEYMTEKLDLDVTILDGYFMFLDIRIPLYKKRTENLFSLKKKYKNKDKMLYNVTKIMANGFYGKTVQLIDKVKFDDELQEDIKHYDAGQGFNPVFGSVITANTRIKVTELQNIYGDDCIAVHTDSVMLKKELKQEYITGKIGGFEYVTEGQCIMIACGMYQLADLCAYRGFTPEREEEDGELKYESWKKILSRSPGAYTIHYPVTRSESWVETVSKGHKDINKFFTDTKEIDLNCDRKRNWLHRMKAKDLLCRNQKSIPLIVIDN